MLKLKSVWSRYHLQAPQIDCNYWLPWLLPWGPQPPGSTGTWCRRLQEPASTKRRCQTLSQEFCADLEDCVGIKDSGESFVDLILDLGRSVNSLLVVVLCLGDGVQLEKGSCVKTELNCSTDPTFFTSSICFWAVVTCVWSVWHFSANVFQFPALFCNKMLSFHYLESDQLTLRSSSLFFAVVVVFSQSAFISLSFSPRNPFNF